MGAVPQRTQIPRASAAPCTAARGRPGCRLLKGKALWGSLCVKTVQGSEGDMADPYNGCHSPYLHLLAFKPLSTVARQPTAAHSQAQCPWSHAVTSTCPTRLHTCSPRAPPASQHGPQSPEGPLRPPAWPMVQVPPSTLQLCVTRSAHHVPALHPRLDLIPQHRPLSPSLPSQRGEKGHQRWTGQ